MAGRIYGHSESIASLDIYVGQQGKLHLWLPIRNLPPRLDFCLNSGPPAGGVGNGCERVRLPRQRGGRPLTLVAERYLACADAVSFRLDPHGDRQEGHHHPRARAVHGATGGAFLHRNRRRNARRT